MSAMETETPSGDLMFQTMSSKEVDIKTKQQVLKQFKADAKHGKIDLQEVPRYFEALSVAVDINHELAPLLAFTALTTLVKVTAISNKQQLLKNQLYLVLPIILNKLGDSNNDIKTRARKSLEDCWLTSHSQTSQLIMDVAIPNRNPAVVLETINWINNFLINSNPQLNLGPLIPSLIEAIHKHSSKVPDNHIIHAIINLLTNFCNMKDNFRFKYKISKELDNYMINDDLKEKIENSIGINDIPLQRHNNKVPESNEKRQESSHNSFKPSASIAPSEPKPELRQEPKPAPKQEPEPEMKPESLSMEIEINPDIQAIISKLNGFKFDESLSSLNVSSPDDLYNTTNSLLPPFNSKETESNWGTREKSIIKLRSLIRGNAPNDYLEDLKVCIKDLAGGICKAISSLRTTLSNNGCQLIKELSMILQDSFESLIDLFLPSLNKLCSATKNIASLNAHVTICSILMHCSYSLKYMQRIYNSSIDKNIKNRSYSATWLQIMMVRFHDDPSFVNLTPSQHSNMNGFEITLKSLTKLLSDPNPTVRSAAKEAYWSFTKYFSEESEALKTRLEPNILRAIERSKPVLNRQTPGSSSGLSHSGSISRSSSRSSRPSIRESIIAKNKELRAKQREETSTPVPGAISRTSSDRIQRNSLNQNNMSTTNQPMSNTKKEENKGLERTSSRYQSKSLPNTNIGIQRQQSMNRRGRLDDLARKDPQTRKETQSSSLAHSERPVRPDESERMNVKSRNTLPPPTRPKTTDSPGTLQAIHSNFDKTNDPMKAFLKSANSVENEHGIDLLKYAINQNEEIDYSELRSFLLKIGNSRVDILKPLFKNCPLHKCSQFFKPEDFFRISILVVDSIDESFVDSIISIFDLHDIYKSIDTLLGYCISLEHLQADDSLGTQIIRYKSQIMLMIFQFMTISLNKIPISDKYFSSIVSTLFELTSLAKSTKLYDPLSQLLHKLHSINQSLFMTELNLKDSTTVAEVGTIIDLDNLTDFTTHNATYDFTTTNFANLTRVFPNNDNSVKGSPFKGSSDLTMLMPVGYTNDNDYKFEPIRNKSPAGIQEEPELSDSTSSDPDRMNVDNEPANDAGGAFLKSGANEAEQSKQQEVLKDFREVIGSENAYNSNTPQDPERPKSKDTLADEFSQVKITERELQLQEDRAVDQKDSILSFIDKVDPLKSVSEKNKHINIYEDENPLANDNSTGSPTKRKNYDYTEFNWFNFQLARFPKGFDQDVNKTEFEILTKKLGENRMEKQEFLKLLNYLQNTMKFDMDFTNYYYNEGRKIIEGSLWDLFENYHSIGQSNILRGLIILKQLLINRVKLNLNKVFKLLANLSELEDTLINEYDHATNEIFDELITGTYPRGEILAVLLRHLSEITPDDPTNKLLFIFESNLKMLSVNFVQDLDNEGITIMEHSLRKFLNFHHVEVRRLVVMNYGKLLKNFELNNLSKVHSVKDPIFQNLTPPQKKLIEYYSKV